MSYSHAGNGVDGDVQEEKELNVISTNPAAYEPVDRHDGFEDLPPPPMIRAHEPEEGSSWEEHGVLAEAHQDMPHTAEYTPSGVDHLMEPGMGPEELARLEEEERRLDEAIAEAEQRRRPSEV